MENFVCLALGKADAHTLYSQLILYQIIGALIIQINRFMNDWLLMSVLYFKFLFISEAVALPIAISRQ